MQNIEKRKHRPGQYVGYSERGYFIIVSEYARGKKAGARVRYGWRATNGFDGQMLFSRTLRDMSAKLAALTPRGEAIVEVRAAP